MIIIIGFFVLLVVMVGLGLLVTKGADQNKDGEGRDLPIYEEEGDGKD